jgi:glycosyltransferase involved in cell wall biosynthesis
MLRLGKGDAVRKGFEAARGDVLMILDADLTVPPEDLPRFFNALAGGKAEFVNGNRLLYPMEERAMKFVNYLGNKLFSSLFTWMLGQRIRDTLCGTKALRREAYQRIAEGRSYFGDFDPFGDFDLLFGAARLGLRIVDVPVRYRRRRTGVTKVRVIRHGLLLIAMSLVAFRKFKLSKWVGAWR